MKLYNTESKKIEELKPLNGKVFKIYSCGPTVYNFAHIGNLRTYLNVDFLRRFLKYQNFRVDQVMNITDVEDKIIRDAQKEGLNPEDKKDLKEFTKKFEKAFFADLESLNVEKVEHYPHATDERVIKKMIEIIMGLLNKGIAYQADDGVYFSVSKAKKYGKLVNLEKKNIDEGHRIDSDEYDKEDIRDFALWKGPRNGEPSWDAPFGPGRPGWHIECSAMSLLELGETIDIHTGGVDLIFPHHENEIAQSESFTGKKFARNWFHGEHLLINGERMGKSLKNFYTLTEMAEKFKVEPLAFRMLALMSHYREKLNFTEKSIKDAQTALSGLRTFLQKVKGTIEEDKLPTILKKTEEKFIDALEEDLNTPKAMATIFELLKLVNKTGEISKKDVESLINTFKLFEKVLALNLFASAQIRTPISIDALVKQRETARKAKDYAKADELRRKIEEQGWGVEDTPEGPLTYIK